MGYLRPSGKQYINNKVNGGSTELKLCAETMLMEKQRGSDVLEQVQFPWLNNVTQQEVTEFKCTQY